MDWDNLVSQGRAALRDHYQDVKELLDDSKSGAVDDVCDEIAGDLVPSDVAELYELIEDQPWLGELGPGFDMIETMANIRVGMWDEMSEFIDDLIAEMAPEDDTEPELEVEDE